MRHFSAHILAVTLAGLSTTTLAQVPAADQDHAAHHPAGASAPASAPKQAPKAAASPDTPMKAMQEMHGKMMAAKTVEERRALMADHMKAMQGGMSMMGRMKSKKDMSVDALAKRMDMMEMMMQMMMDREAARSSAAK